METTPGLLAGSCGGRSDTDANLNALPGPPLETEDAFSTSAEEIQWKKYHPSRKETTTGVKNFTGESA